MFQIVRCAVDENGMVAAQLELQPPFELWEDATALAEFDASRLGGEYGYDEERNCWWASDTRGQRYRFEVKEVPSTDIAA